MKTHAILREFFALTAAAAATASIVAIAPLARAQQSPPPPPPPTASPASGDQADIFDAIKKGADKLQKEARKTRDIEPQLRLLAERQDQFIREAAEVKKQMESEQKALLAQLVEAKKELTAALAKQDEEISKLSRLLEHMNAEMKAHHAAMPPAPPTPPASADAPAPGSPLPVTEPPVKPLPTATP